MNPKFDKMPGRELLRAAVVVGPLMFSPLMPSAEAASGARPDRATIAKELKPIAVNCAGEEKVIIPGHRERMQQPRNGTLLLSKENLSYISEVVAGAGWDNLIKDIFTKAVTLEGGQEDLPKLTKWVTEIQSGKNGITAHLVLTGIDAKKSGEYVQTAPRQRGGKAGVVGREKCTYDKDRGAFEIFNQIFNGDTGKDAAGIQLHLGTVAEDGQSTVDVGVALTVSELLTKEEGKMLFVVNAPGIKGFQPIIWALSAVKENGKIVLRIGEEVGRLRHAGWNKL